MITVFATILLSILPMRLSPLWNGEIPGHRNQYEKLADSILDGHINIEYDDIDEKLVNMDNPYDPQKRAELGVRYHWDHAFYNGKYYMYFGVAPVFIFFIPYKVITGHALTTYHATQAFATFYIIGMFYLLYLIYTTFFKNLKLVHYLLLSVALSVLSIWVSICQPALYCTAIVSGLCMAIWSLYFYMKAVYGDNSLNRSIMFATLGALFGALTFACRPPIGLVNILVIPLLIEFFKKHGFNKNVFFKVLIAVIPYIVIASLLMIYNYARFENVFEFGQSYQLTIADQHNYLNIFSRIDLKTILNDLSDNFIRYAGYSNSFPFVNISGIFFNFPILVIPFILIINKKFLKSLKEKRLLLLYIFLMIVPILVIIIDTLGAPNVLERYHLDEYYLLAVLTFIAIANYYSLHDKSKILSWLIILISIITIIKCVLLFFVPFDCNYAAMYPEVNKKINDFILFFK